MKKRGKRERKKLLKSIKKLKVGDSVCIGDYEIICIDDKFYLAVHQQYGLFDKTYDELEDWISNGGILD